METVLQKCAYSLGVEPTLITVDAHFVNDLGADSLETVELVMELEEEFGLDIPDDAASELHTLGDVVRYLQSEERQ